MKVLLIGKSNALFWLEHLHDAFTSFEDVKVKKIATNRLGIFYDTLRAIKRVVNKKDVYFLSKKIVEEKIKSFNPDLIIVISPFILNTAFIQALDKASKNCIKVAWVGDMFNEKHRYLCNSFDILYCTDTGFIKEALDIGFKKALYLPLGVNEKIFNLKNLAREDSLLFVGAPTQKRVEFIKELSSHEQIKLAGKGWNCANESKIKILKSNVKIEELPTLYNRANFILNMKHEVNVINGLNMRSFEATACGACLLQERVLDVVYNFEEGKELIVYNCAEELSEKLKILKKEPALLKNIQENGYKRVMSEHTYRHRAEKILQHIKGAL